MTVCVLTTHNPFFILFAASRLHFCLFVESAFIRCSLHTQLIFISCFKQPVDSSQQRLAQQDQPHNQSDFKFVVHFGDNQEVIILTCSAVTMNGLRFDRIRYDPDLSHFVMLKSCPVLDQSIQCFDLTYRSKGRPLQAKDIDFRLSLMCSSFDFGPTLGSWIANSFDLLMDVCSFKCCVKQRRGWLQKYDLILSKKMSSVLVKRFSKQLCLECSRKLAMQT